MKKLKVLVTALIVSFAVACGGMTFVAAGPAHAAEEPNRVMPSISVNNGEFSSTSGSSSLADASDWTGEFAGVSEDAGVYHGVVDSAAPDYAAAGFKDKAIIETLRSANLTHKSKNANDNNTNALLINNTVESVYRYSSSEFTVPANGYLTVTLDVFTGDFPSGQSAFVSFSADEFKDLSFEIETGNEWQTFTFAIRGYRYRTVSTKLQLGVGVSATDRDDAPVLRSAKGYAFFDSVDLTLRTPDQFDYFYGEIIGDKTEGIVSQGNTKVWLAEENESQPIGDPSFSQDIAEKHWQTKDVAPNTNVFTGVSSALTNYSYADEALLDPYAPFSADGRILSVQSSKGGSATVEAGDDSLFELPRFGYARVSVWVNMVNAKRDTAVTLTLATDDDYTEKSGSVSSVTAQDENSWTEGWGEAVFLLKGSPFDVRRLRLSMSVSGLYGAVSFDNVSYEILTGEQYSALSGGTSIEMDATADTVTNGSFNAFDTVGKNDVLPPASSWTVEASDDSISGVAPLDDYFGSAEFLPTRKKLALGPTEKPERLYGKNNALLIRHVADAYTSYQSSSISAPTESSDTDKSEYNLIKVQIASWLDAGDYASIELYANDVKVAEFPRVNTSDNKNFVTYTFSVKIDTDKTPTYSVKLVAGTEAKPVSGSVWVNNVWIGNSKTAATAGDTVKSVALDTTMFDAVSGNGPYYDNFVWGKISNADSNAATLGFVKTKNYDGSAYSDALKEMFVGANGEYGMYLASDTDVSAGLQHSFDVAFTESTFVKVTARIKTRGFEQDQGARFVLGAHEIKKINTEYIRADELTEDLLPDYHNGVYSGWREYTFYVNVGSTTGQTAKLAVWLGDGSKPSELRTGKVLVDEIKVATITETEYNDATAVFDEYDEDEEDKLPTNALRVVLSETKDNGGNNAPNADVSNGGINPWVIPSVLFGVAVVIAIVGFAIKKYLSRPHKAKQTAAGVVSYDRNNKIETPKPRVTAEPEEENGEDDFEEIDYNAPLVHTPFAEEADETQTPSQEPDAEAETTAEASEAEAETTEAEAEADDEATEPAETTREDVAESAQQQPEAIPAEAEKPAPKKPTAKDFDSFDD